MKIQDYFTPWRTDQFECTDCGWKGPGSALSMDCFEGLTELSCPAGVCDTNILGLPHPTTRDVEVAAAAGNEEARQMIKRPTSTDQ
jgi:hypothetical protein